MEAENGKETQLLNPSLRKCAQIPEQLVIPLMILDIRPFASGITNCLLMLTNKNPTMPKEERKATKSWMSTQEMKNLFAIGVNKNLVDDYEKTVRKSLENSSQTGLQHVQIRLDTQLLPRQHLDKLAYDRLAWVESLRIQLGIAEKRRAAHRRTIAFRNKRKRKIAREVSRSSSQAMEDKENGPFDEDSTFDTQSVFLIDGHAVQNFQTAGNNNYAKHTNWKILKQDQEVLKRQRILERKARHTARWELKDPKVYDCKVDRRNRAKTRKSCKIRRLEKRQTSKKVLFLKSLKLRFARRKAEIVSSFSTHLESCRDPTKGPKQQIKTQTVAHVVSQFVDRLTTDR